MNDLTTLIRKTLSDFGNRDYIRITGDKHMEKVPETLWKLWYSDESHSMALSNVEYYFYRAKNGEEDREVFYTDLLELRRDLANEFGNLMCEAIEADSSYVATSSKNTLITKIKKTLLPF